jgi:hypothetical protein
MRVARLLAATTTVAFVFIGNGIAVAQAGRGLGIFENQTDVGSVVPPGVASFDAASGVFTIRSSGANLWVNVDAFHFVWKKVSGDVALTADVKLADAGSTASPHRKALIMFRQSLDSDAMYGDAAIHGNGETALQYRRNKGDTTQDIAFNIGAPQRLRLEKRGDTITLFLSAHGEPAPGGSVDQAAFRGRFLRGARSLCAQRKCSGAGHLCACGAAVADGVNYCRACGTRGARGNTRFDSHAHVALQHTPDHRHR